MTFFSQSDNFSFNNNSAPHRGSGHLRQNQKPPWRIGKDFMRCGMEKGKENCHSGTRGTSQARKGAHGSFLLKRLRRDLQAYEWDTIFFIEGI